MPLPTCECVNGLPTQQQLGAIYCALLDILAASGGGEITLSQITDLDPSWITPLQAPLANFSVTASQISDATASGAGLLTTLPAGDSAGSFVTMDDTNTAGVRLPGITQNGLTSVDTDHGIVINGT